MLIHPGLRRVCFFLFVLMMTGFSPLQGEVVQGPNLTSEAYEAFGKLPVLDQGRVKPLDTVARHGLAFLRGRASFKYHDQKITSIQWLTDTIFGLSSSDDYPVFRVEHQALLALLGKPQNKIGYVSFRELIPYADMIEQDAQRYLADSEIKPNSYQRATILLYKQMGYYLQLKSIIKPSFSTDFSEDLMQFDRVAHSQLSHLDFHSTHPDLAANNGDLQVLLSYFQRLQSLSSAVRIKAVPAHRDHDPAGWKSVPESVLHRLSGQPFDLPVLSFSQMDRAYQHRDSRAFIQAVQDYDHQLNKQLPQTMTQVGFEYRFNKADVFTWCMVFYVLAFLLLMMGFLLQSQGLQRGAFWIVFLGFLVQTVGICARMWIQGRPPVTNLYSSALFVGWIALLGSLFLERFYRSGMGSLVGSIAGLATLVIADRLALLGTDTMELMQAVLNSNFWLSTHVVTITMGYGGAFLTGLIAHFYILQGVLTKRLTPEARKQFVSMVYACALFSILFSTVGTILGGIWADQSWGRFWGWDPKENGALMIVLWMSVILHARWAGLVRERGLMMMAIFGNIVTSFSWFGVNLLGVGLHSYGFMEKGAVGLVVFVFFELFVMWLALLPNTYWRSLKS